MARIIIQIVILLLCSFNLLAQSSDTLSVYFEFGKHEISSKQMRRIQLIPQNVFVNDLDSVYYIGMADSVGSLRANKKLGERRANEVSKYSKKYFTTDPKIVITSRGELQSNDPAKNRRVDVIFFKKPIPIVEEPIIIPDTLCLERADSLFHRSLVRDIQFRRKNYVAVETILARKELNKYYYMRMVPREQGTDTFSIHKIRWSMSKSKSAIDQSSDYYAKVPKSDFDRFSIFTISKPACNAPSLEHLEYFEQESGPITKCLQVDRFLMHHLQVRKIPFNEDEVLVRVPKIYVNTEHVYTFYNLGDTVLWSDMPTQSTSSEGNSKRWLKKWRLKRYTRKTKKAASEKYFYTRVRVNSNFVLENIMRMMDCTPSYSEPSEGSKPFCSTLGPCLLKKEGGLDLFVEAGSHSFLAEQRNYLALGVLTDKNLHRWQFSLGVSDSASFYGSLGYDYRLINFGISNPKDFTSWSEPGKLKAPKTYFSMYGGTRISSFEFRDNDWSWNQNLHLGASLQRVLLGIETNLFAEGGVGVNYTLPQKSLVSPYFQGGVRLFIFTSSKNSSQVTGSGRFL